MKNLYKSDVLKNVDKLFNELIVKEGIKSKSCKNTGK